MPLRQRLFGKLSSLLRRSSLFFEQHSGNRITIAPQRLSYKADPSLPKIVHINGNFVIGGTSQLIADVVERTSDRYYHEVIVPDYPRPLPYQPLKIHAFGLDRLPELFNWLKEAKPVLVHIHYWVRPQHRYFDFGCWYATVFSMCEELGLPVIQNINVPTSPFISTAVVHQVFVSEYVRSEFDNHPTVPSSVIYPGSNLDLFSENEERTALPETIGMVYRLDRDKLDAQVIDIFIEAVRLKPSLRVYIVGGGFYYDEFRRRVRDAQLEKQFVFTGYVAYRSLPEWYRKIGVFVAPVHDESFGQVTPFAMGMGLPVAGYHTGALPEILGTTETLVPFGDHMALADLLVKLVNDPQRRKELGQQNYQRAHKKFGIDTMIRQYSELYRSIIVSQG